MDYMELEFPGDARDALVHTRRNMSDAERWSSMAAGVSLAAYGLVRRPRFGWMLAGIGALLLRRGMTGRCHTYELFGINTAGTGSDTRRVLGGGGGITVDESVTIDRPVELLYRFWRNLENLPRFMPHLESVERVTDTLSRWRAEGPGGSHVEWSAEIINEVPNQVIGWRSIEGSDVVSAGSVHFDDAGATRDARPRQASVQSARGQGRGGDREAGGSRSRHRDSRRPASVQAAHRKQRRAGARRRRVSTRRTRITPISFADFEKPDVRVGRIVRAEPFPEARKPAYKLVIDFGPGIGHRTSSAQLTLRYQREALEGRLVMAVVNLPPRQIGPFRSEVLTLGVPDADGAVILLVPDAEVPVGGRMF